MFSFHALKVASVERIAEDAHCMTLEVPPTLRDTAVVDVRHHFVRPSSGRME